MFRRLAVGLGAVLMLGLPASALGSPGWVAGRGFPLSPEALPGTAEVRFQSGGTATESFLHVASLTPPYVTAVHVGIVAPGGVYEDQLAINSTLTSFPIGVSIAVAPDGAAVAAWTEAVGSVSGPDRYLAAYRRAGSDTWEAPFTIATDEEVPPSNEVGSTNLEPVIAANGAAAVGIDHMASKEAGSGGQKVQRIDVAVHPAGGAWSAQRISPVGISAEYLDFASDAAGDLTAAYQQRYLESGKFKEGNDRYHVVTRRLPASSGIWAPALELTTGSTTDADAVTLGENERGDAVVAWQLDNYGAKTLNTEAVTRKGAEGSWTTAAQAVTGSSVPIAAAVAPDEDAYVMYWYSGNSSAEDCIGAVHAFVTGTFFKPTCLSPTEEGSSAGSIAFREDDAYMTWTAFTPGEPAKKQTVQGAIWRAGAETPDAATNLDAPNMSYGSPTVVPDGEGSVVAFYSLMGGEGGGELRAAAYDASPPILVGSDIPTTATAGVPVTFGASFADLWSELAPGQPTWSFGDGSAPVAGDEVTHTFAKPGTYTITLAASDPLGNSSSSSHTIVVAPAQISPPPPARPEITLNRPTCKKRMSKAACKRYRSSPAAWRNLSGGVTDATRVQIAVYRTHRKHTESLHGGRFRRSTIKQAAKTFVPLMIEKGRWSLRLPKLISGSYTIDVRAVDAAGAEAQLLAKVTVS